MTQERPTRERSTPNSAVSSQQLLRIASFKIPVTVVALGASVILHGGLLATAYFVTWSPALTTHPKLNFTRGNQAAPIQVLLVPWPDPADKEKTKEEPHKEASLPESPPATVSAKKADAARLPEDDAPNDCLDPPVTASENRNPLTLGGMDAVDVAEVRTVEDVRDFPPAGDAADTTSKEQSVGAIVGNFLRQLAHATSQPKTRPNMNSHEPPVATAVDDATAPLPQEAINSKASSSQTTGVETGVEALDLPTPKYPSLSRRQGEEGLVLLQVEVLADGKVGAITVLRDAGFARLTEAAIAAARKGHFNPATRDGHPVRATVRIPFRFVLR